MSFGRITVKLGLLLRENREVVLPLAWSGPSEAPSGIRVGRGGQTTEAWTDGEASPRRRYAPPSFSSPQACASCWPQRRVGMPCCLHPEWLVLSALPAFDLTLGAGWVPQRRPRKLCLLILYASPVVVLAHIP